MSSGPSVAPGPSAHRTLWPSRGSRDLQASGGSTAPSTVVHLAWHAGPMARFKHNHPHCSVIKVASKQPRAQDVLVLNVEQVFP